MPRFKLTIEYQGTRYHGWQAQKDARTVQGEIAKALKKAVGSGDFELYGAGRTDAGVHALGQVAHLEIEPPIEAEELRRRCNNELPSDIHILAIERADPRFHARHHAVARSYLYQISRRRTAFGKKLVWWIREDLDLARMTEAGRLFIGMKDCRSFAVADVVGKSTRVLIDKVRMAEAGDLILIRIEGSHFLWKMVRRIVGVIAEVGRKRLTAEKVARFLEVESNEPARLAAPASGLFLERVYYKGDSRLDALEPVIAINSPCVPARKQ